MGFRDRTFNVEGVPITFYEIEMWYTELLKSDKKKAEELGNPYKSNTVCEYIAKLIYNEMIQKINKNFGINIESENKKYTEEKKKNQKEFEKKQKEYERKFPSYFDRQNEKNSWASVDKFIEIMNYAKQKAYEQQYGKQQS
ncbi:MAG: hypothetical protein ACOC56_06510, partial [Atribacterota bacterium]